MMVTRQRTLFKEVRSSRIIKTTKKGHLTTLQTPKFTWCVSHPHLSGGANSAEHTKTAIYYNKYIYRISFYPIVLYIFYH